MSDDGNQTGVQDPAKVPRTEPMDADAAIGAEPSVSGVTLTRLRGPAAAAISLRWAPIVASVIAVFISLAGIWVAGQDPEVIVILPDRVRLAGGHLTGNSYLYLQPTFVSTGNNDRIEVVRDMRVMVRPRDEGIATELTWDERVTFGQGEDGRLSYRYDGDAAPLLISPSAAQNPFALFNAPAGWFFEEGSYEFTLVADRVVGGRPLEVGFEVT